MRIFAVQKINKYDNQMLVLKSLFRYPLFLLFPVIYLIGKVKKYVLKPDYKKILIVHFGGTGDILMCTPAIRLLKRNYPSSEVRFIVSDRLAVDVLERNQNVDEKKKLEFFY